MDFLDERMSLPIQGISIDWDNIDEGSYLREIEAIKGLDYFFWRLRSKNYGYVEIHLDKRT